MDVHVFILNAVGYLADFEEDFADLVAEMTPDDLDSLAVQFNHILSKYPSENLTADTFARLVDELITTLTQFPELATLLNVDSRIWKHRPNQRLSDQVLSAIFLENSTSLPEQKERANQVHKLQNDAHPNIIRLASKLNQQARASR